MRRFCENLPGRRASLVGPMPKAQALQEEGLAGQPDRRSGRGPDARCPRPLRPGGAATPVTRFDHPHSWAGFILIGDPN
jgi:CHAT domain-containing protein